MILNYLQGITVESLKEMFIDAFQPVLDKLSLQADERTIMIMLVVTGLLGVLHCLFGYRLVRLWIGLYGFFWGFNLGWRFARSLNVNPTTGIIVAAISGLAFCLILALLLKLGIFLFSATVGGFLAVYVLSTYVRYFDNQATIMVIIVLAAALAIGGVAVHFMRPILIVLTGIVGGIIFAAAIAVLLNMSQSIDLFFIGGVIVAVLGMLFQFATSRD